MPEAKHNLGCQLITISFLYWLSSLGLCSKLLHRDDSGGELHVGGEFIMLRASRCQGHWKGTRIYPPTKHHHVLDQMSLVGDRQLEHIHPTKRKLSLSSQWLDHPTFGK